MLVTVSAKVPAVMFVICFPISSLKKRIQVISQLSTLFGTIRIGNHMFLLLFFFLYIRGVIQKYAEKCHYFHNFNANYNIFVHNQANFMPI